VGTGSSELLDKEELGVTGPALAKRQARRIIPDLFGHNERAPRPASPHLGEVHLRRGRRQGQVLVYMNVAISANDFLVSVGT
jgi:hypothetical protein